METILLAGGSGLIGTRLVELLKDKYKIHILTRSPEQDEENVKYFHWDIYKKEADRQAFVCDYIINLNGAGIADKRWTAQRKKVLIDSRVEANRTIALMLAKTDQRPKGIFCASAMGYYGDSGDRLLNEDSPEGKGFLAECCAIWEESSSALKPFAKQFGMIRIGLVLAKEGGALPKLLMTKSIGMVPYFGDGSQYFSWIHIDDLCGMFMHMIEHPEVNGIFNGVAPVALTNKALASAICDALHGSQITVPAPSFPIRLAMGEMADVILNSNRIAESRISLEHGYKYQFGEIDVALGDLLG